MHVEMKVKIEGTRNGVRWPAPGSVVELGDGEAADLIGLGYAVEVDAPAKKAAAPKPEKAVAAKPETRKS